MDSSVLFALFVAAFVNAVLPGPCVILTFGRTVRAGVPAGLVVTAGILAADLVLVATAVGVTFGLVALAPAAFPAMKWLGIVCLVALALRSVRAATVPVETTRPTHDGAGGFVVGLSSPYNLLFYGAVLPQALPVMEVDVGAALLTVAVTLTAIALAQLGVVALAAGCRGMVGGRGRWIDCATAGALLMIAAASASVPMAREEPPDTLRVSER